METGQPYPFKGFWIRLVASFIDGIILLILIILLATISLVIFGAALGEGAGVGMFLLVFILASIATILYKPIMEASEYQGTVGKYALGMKVVDQNGQRITMTSSFLRTILYIIGAQGFLLCLGVVMIGFTEYKQGLHDILANTYVVTTYWEGPVPLEDNFGG
tara:strand:- start:5052 stop:5537 length:486 start_codon:yes stop_codon:yes gene_type:complete